MQNIKIHSIKNAPKNACMAFAAKQESDLSALNLSKEELAYVKNKLKAKEKNIVINRFSSIMLLLVDNEVKNLEQLRLFGNKALALANQHKYNQLHIDAVGFNSDEMYAIAEGAALSNYQFLQYKSEKSINTVAEISVGSNHLSKTQIEQLSIITESVFMARNWVNTPVMDLDAVGFAKQMEKAAKSAGIKTEVLTKKQIQSLKMGGLLAVNLGSKTPPTFTIMEYKPAKCVNKQPLVLVGKGVVYDTGGLSLKPTPNSMDHMKCDMAGGATVAAAIYAIAKAKLPYYVVALVPATDNRPGEMAYTPGDVITMYDKQTVEVLNTDAEGRMLLGDALAYAKKYKPELVMDFATLTGAAAAAIGPFATVFMGTANEEVKQNLKQIGQTLHERLAEFPFWDDYADLLKSDIADMKNIGGPIAGAITAGKFLEKFTDYPWLHFDIAAPAYLDKPEGYRPKNGTGTGVRLIFEFVKQLCNKK